jgi:hypothetical protein
MSYLKDFLTQIASRDYPAFVRLWEEYCMSDEVDPFPSGKSCQNPKKSTKFLNLSLISKPPTTKSCARESCVILSSDTPMPPT